LFEIFGVTLLVKLVSDLLVILLFGFSYVVLAWRLQVKCLEVAVMEVLWYATLNYPGFSLSNLRFYILSVDESYVFLLQNHLQELSSPSYTSLATFVCTFGVPV